jgi:hypothetical protein
VHGILAHTVRQLFDGGLGHILEEACVRKNLHDTAHARVEHHLPEGLAVAPLALLLLFADVLALLLLRLVRLVLIERAV